MDYATSELVAVAWFGQRVARVTAGAVATTLPADVSKWADLGFVQVQVSAAGRIDPIIPQRRLPVVTVDYWAASPGSNRPPWGKANQLVEYVRAAIEGQHYGQRIDLPANYTGARVQSVYAVGEAARVEGDPSGYARYTQDFAIDWVLNP